MLTMLTTCQHRGWSRWHTLFANIFAKTQKFAKLVLSVNMGPRLNILRKTSQFSVLKRLESGSKLLPVLRMRHLFGSGNFELDSDSNICSPKCCFFRQRFFFNVCCNHFLWDFLTKYALFSLKIKLCILSPNKKFLQVKQLIKFKNNDKL